MPYDVDGQVVPVRLADGNDMYEGRVEIFHDNRWGQVILGDNYDSNANRVCSVVCNQLGYRCVQANCEIVKFLTVLFTTTRITQLFPAFMSGISLFKRGTVSGLRSIPDTGQTTGVILLHGVISDVFSISGPNTDTVPLLQGAISSIITHN